jgi:Bicoid-interacting protein 3 (Bin3)
MSYAKRLKRSEISQEYFAVYGNFPGYYGCRDPKHAAILSDDRLAIIRHYFQQRQETSSIFSGKKVLDSAAFVLGIDIDPILITKARKHVSFHYSLLRPLSDDAMQVPNDKTYERADLHYFPISMPILFGPRRPSSSAISPNPNTSATASFPNNILFKCQNWIEDALYPNNALSHECSVDMIICMSVTKWIHLNWGDPGIVALFRKGHWQLKPQGYIYS